MHPGIDDETTAPAPPPPPRQSQPTKPKGILDGMAAGDVLTVERTAKGWAVHLTSAGVIRTLSVGAERPRIE